MNLDELIAGKLSAAVGAGAVAKTATIAVANPEQQNAVDSGSVAKIAGIATSASAKPEGEPYAQTEAKGLATAISAILATQGPEALRVSMVEAGEGLPVTVAELLRAYGEEGAAEFAAGHDCSSEHMRALAVAVSERLQRDRQIEPPPPAPGSLDGLALLREDWRFVDRRTGHRHDRQSLLTEYRRRWIEAAEAEPVEYRAANTGRRAANAWLLKATDRPNE